MSLTSRVKAIPSTGGWWPPVSERRSEMMKIATTCHFATVYWLFHEAFDREINFDEYLKIGNPNTFINGLLKYGTALQQSYRRHQAEGLKVKATGAVVPAGSLIVFAENKNVAGHSCVALTSQSIGGYNQTNWFSTAGKEADYSTHSTKDIQWKTKHVALHGDHEYSLLCISEKTAVDAMKAAGA
jgi:hypothetical protein